MRRRNKGNPDRLQNNPVEAAKRNARNTHNGMFGGTAIARRWMTVIQNASTVTDMAKAEARLIERSLQFLETLLKVRLD